MNEVIQIYSSPFIQYIRTKNMKNNRFKKKDMKSIFSDILSWFKNEFLLLKASMEKYSIMATLIVIITPTIHTSI